MTPPKIPTGIINRFEAEMQDLQHGGISLIVQFRDGKATYRIEKVVSILAGGRSEK